MGPLGWKFFAHFFLFVNILALFWVGMSIFVALVGILSLAYAFCLVLPVYLFFWSFRALSGNFFTLVNPFGTYARCFVLILFGLEFGISPKCFPFAGVSSCSIFRGIFDSVCLVGIFDKYHFQTKIPSWVFGRFFFSFRAALKRGFSKGDFVYNSTFRGKCDDWVDPVRINFLKKGFL